MSPDLTLEKLLVASRSYSGQIVVPAGMYNLAPAETARTGSPRQMDGNSSARSAPRKTPARSRSIWRLPACWTSSPELASRLEDLSVDLWKDRVAILTLWFPRDGAVLLVRAEILEKAVPTVKKVGYTHKGHVDYETLTVCIWNPSSAKAISSSGKKSAE